MTMMNQLAQKAVLRVDKERQPYLYEPAIRKEQIVQHRLAQFVDQVFDGQAGELVLRLVDEAKLTDDDIRRIEAKIEAREKKRSDHQ
jgi:predicted transcriptional regulator